MNTPMTGADLADRLRTAAAQRHTSLSQFLRPLTKEPVKYLSQLEVATRPKAATINRIDALLGGRDVAPPPVNNFQTRPRSEWRSGRAQAGLQTMPKIVDAPLPIEARDPCLRCGTRADRHVELGCKRWLGPLSAR